MRRLLRRPTAWCVMNYDEHYPGAASGPVASQDWFVDNLKFAERVIPREK